MSEKRNSAKNRMAVIIHSGEFDKVHHALSMALAAISIGLECHLFIAYDALRRMTRADIDKVPPEATIRRSLKSLLDNAKNSGQLHLFACGASMGAMGINRSELVDEFEDVLGLTAFLSDAEGASLTFFV